MKKRKGVIKIANLESKDYPFAVDFDGYNEGSGNPCENETEVKECVDMLIAGHQSSYDLEIIDLRKKEMQMTL